MKISHVAIFTVDLERLKSFYEKYFGAVSGELYNNTNTGFKSYFLRFDGESSIEIMSKPNVCESAVDEMLGISHIALCVGSEEEVIILTKRLCDDGYVHISGPRRTGDGYFESCMLDPDGNRIEITV